MCNEDEHINFEDIELKKDYCLYNIKFNNIVVVNFNENEPILNKKQDLQINEVDSKNEHRKRIREYRCSGGFESLF